jgi:S-adenosylmethionine synthetase
MDDWATRYPTNVTDVARVLVDLAAKSTSTQLPHILHFSAQQLYTKYSISLLFAKLHNPPLELGDNLVRVTDGPKPGETIRPRDCHLSNVRRAAFRADCACPR